jgi:hypothetical protein
MKTSVLGLWLATAAVGGGSIYLWIQLQAERERADGLAAQVAEFTARIAQLETAREGRRVTGANTFGGQAMVARGQPPAPPADGGITNEPDGSEVASWAPPSTPERSEAMRKMMRAQIRANNKRLYADVGSKLGLSKDAANKLIDLLTDQQSGGFEAFSGTTDEAGYRNAWAEQQRQLQAEITELLGADKVASFQEYQKSLPARQELEMLMRQLEGYDAPLTEDQRKGLLKVMVEERERVPAPDYTDGADVEGFQKTLAAWEEDYQERVAAQSRGILDSAQLNAFSEYQQAQKDMRAHLGALLPAGPPRVARGIKSGIVSFTRAVPAGGVMMSADAVLVTAPPEGDRKE